MPADVVVVVVVVVVAVVVVVVVGGGAIVVVVVVVTGGVVVVVRVVVVVVVGRVVVVVAPSPPQAASTSGTNRIMIASNQIYLFITGSLLCVIAILYHLCVFLKKRQEGEAGSNVSLPFLIDDFWSVAWFNLLLFYFNAAIDASGTLWMKPRLRTATQRLSLEIRILSYLKYPIIVSTALLQMLVTF
jgi:hypothetical protein